jgi:hypothetical protein
MMVGTIINYYISLIINERSKQYATGSERQQQQQQQEVAGGNMSQISLRPEHGD